MTARSAVVIGVDRTGGLPLLKGAAADAKRVADWLDGEGFEVRLLTDTKAGNRATGEVTAESVVGEVGSIVAQGTCEQLVVYFAGHGLNNFGTEIWLLSRAPHTAHEAINLALSVDLARDCGIASVCFISDACRSNPPAGPMRRVTGIPIFPNEMPPPGRRAKVDKLLPTIPNAVANEVDEKIDDVVQRGGIFTAELLRAHGFPAGETPDSEDPERDLVRHIQRNGADVRVIDLSNLAGYLEERVPLAAANKGIAWPQQPECIVETPPRDKFIGRAQFPASRHVVPPPTTPTAVSSGLSERLAESVQRTEAEIRGADQTGSFETQTGIQVTGERVKWARGIEMGAELLPPNGQPFDLVRLHPHAPAGSVVLEFIGGTGTVVAGLGGYIASVQVSNGRVANISYVPSTNSYRWQWGPAQWDTLGKLRAEVAARALHGVFQIQVEEAKGFADRIRVLKALDPTLGLYAAYAYRDGGRPDQVRSVMTYMLDDLGGFSLFDVALLAAEPVDARQFFDHGAPFCPMLMRGWSYLQRFAGAIRPEVLDIANHLVPSLWTTIDAEGLVNLRAAIEAGRLQ
jgi:hypothetical protein